MNKVFTVLGAIALTFTLSMATEMKCGEGKCGGDMAQKAPKASKKAKCGQ